MFRYLSFAAWLSVVALAACSFPTPYETYSPGSVTAPVQPQKAITAYGFAVSPQQMAHHESQQRSEPTPGSSTIYHDTVAICYGRLWNTPESVHSAAAEACGDRTPRIISQDIDLDACPLLTPVHAVFVCTGTPSAHGRATQK